MYTNLIIYQFSSSIILEQTIVVGRMLELIKLVTGFLRKYGTVEASSNNKATSTNVHNANGILSYTICY